jgi:hypothetical protein
MAVPHGQVPLTAEKYFNLMPSYFPTIYQIRHACLKMGESEQPLSFQREKNTVIPKVSKRIKKKKIQLAHLRPNRYNDWGIDCKMVAPGLPVLIKHLVEYTEQLEHSLITPSIRG